jgi:two-component system sensor histidine kinase KdpD
MDDSEQALIFKKFYRRKGHRYVVQGTGTGLFIALAIINAHGGSLCVTSKLGRGCISSFILPMNK